MEQLQVFLIDNQNTIIALINILFLLAGLYIMTLNHITLKQKISLPSIFWSILLTFKQAKIYMFMSIEFIGKFSLFYIVTYGDIKITFLNSVPIFGFLYSTFWYILNM